LFNNRSIFPKVIPGPARYHRSIQRRTFCDSWVSGTAWWQLTQESDVGSFWYQEYSFSSLFVPWTVRSPELSFTGPFVPYRCVCAIRGVELLPLEFVVNVDRC